MAAVPVNTTIQTQIANLYIAILGRNPEPAGFGYWCDTLANNGGTQAALNAITIGFSNSPEFVATYGGQTTEAAIALMYENILDRAPDAAGLAYWVGQANGLIGTYTVAQALALTGNNIITAAAANTGTADQTLIEAKETTAIASGTSAPTTTYTLTTGVDTFTPGSNAIVNGLLGTGATINSFDSVVASGTNNTFNIVDTTTTTGFAMPTSITLAGLQTVNLNRAAVATANTTITNTTFGTAVTALNLVDANTTSSGVVTITLNNATSVSAVNTGNAGFTSVAVTDGNTAAAGVLTTVTAQGVVGAVNIAGNAVNTVNLTTVGGLTTVTAAAGTRAVTVNVAGATGNGYTDTTATTVTINSSVTAAGAVGTYTTAAATTVNYNTTTANGAGAATITAAAAATLNVGGSAVASLTFAGNTALRTVNVAGAGLTADLTTGATGVTALNFTNTAGTSTVTLNLATAVTGGAGVEVITVGAGTAAINLGTGNDTLVLTGAALGTGGTANAGVGGTDVLSMTTANAVTAAATTTFATAVTGFEQLTLNTAGAGTIDLAQLGGYNYVRVTNTAGNALVLNNLPSGGTLEINNSTLNTPITGSVTLGGNTGAGVNDTVNIRLNNATAALAAFGTVVATNVENIAVVISDTQTVPTPLVNTLNTFSINDVSMRSLTLSGTDGVAITLTNPATALQTFDASGITSGVATGNTTNIGVNFVSSALAFSSTAVGTLLGGDVLNFASALATTTITVTAGTNAITGSSTIGSTLNGGTGIDTIVGGDGIDTITVGASAVAITNSITGGAAADSITLTGSLGADTVIYGAANTAVGAAGVNMDTIANFATTVDKIQLTFSAATAGTSTLGYVSTAATVGAMATVIVDQVSVATVADVYTQLASDLVAANFAASTALAGGVVAREVTFASGAAAGTYLVINDNVAGFLATTDMVIKLTGTTTVAAGDFAYSYVA